MMPYIMKGTKAILRYRNTLGRPCSVDRMANAIKAPKILFTGEGRDPESATIRYGEVEAQALAGSLGVTVANVTTNGGQILI
jgi:hypothetical protein